VRLQIALPKDYAQVSPLRWQTFLRLRPQSILALWECEAGRLI
jgi:hypothetical protein